jgi:hypothetical protein
MSANVKQVVPFFSVTNMEASLRFYVDGLGFAIKRSGFRREMSTILPMEGFAGAGLNLVMRRSCCKSSCTNKRLHRF